MIIPNIWKHKTCSKPPTSFVLLLKSRWQTKIKEVPCIQPPNSSEFAPSVRCVINWYPVTSSGPSRISTNLSAGECGRWNLWTNMTEHYNYPNPIIYIYIYMYIAYVLAICVFIVFPQNYRYLLFLKSQVVLQCSWNSCAVLWFAGGFKIFQPNPSNGCIPKGFSNSGTKWTKHFLKSKSLEK